MASKTSSDKVPAIPVLVKKGSNLTIVKIKKELPNDLLKRCIKLSTVSKDQPIYKSVPGDFLRGEFPSLSLVRRFNVLTQTSSTVARYAAQDGSGKFIEKNSNEVVKVIGQNNYDTVFSALCSVISQEIRVKALLALLTIENINSNKKGVSAQTQKSFADCGCQTDETSKNILDNFKVRKRIRRQQFRPYIVKEDNKKVKRIIIDPKSLASTVLKSEKPSQCNTTTSTANPTLNDPTDAEKFASDSEKVENKSLPDLSAYINKDSFFSENSTDNLSISSQDYMSIQQLVDNPLPQEIDNHTASASNVVPLTMLDGSVVMVCAKPMDKFHWAEPEILKNLSETDRNKLLCNQGIIHWKYCLERDEDGYLPVHHAVLTGDVRFLSRQCAALLRKYGSVDVAAEAPANGLTPLQLAVRAGEARCAAELLRRGADPRLPDDAGRSALHAAAADSPPALLGMLLDHCRTNARAMLMEEEELWSPDMERRSDAELASVLLERVCGECDNQGYTPLMVAARLGSAQATRLLLAAAPRSVHRAAPPSGATALHLAVEAACLQAANSTNQAEVSPEYLRTVSALLAAGGDPARETHAGGSVHQLLTDCSCVPLSVLVANRLAPSGRLAPADIGSLMLLKHGDGKVDLTEISTRKPHEKTEAPGGVSEVISKVSGSAEPTSTTAAGKKSSNVEIKDIRTVKVVFAGRAAGGAGGAPGRVVVVQNAETKPNPDVPKYVKIAPKVAGASKTKSANCDPTPVKKQRKK